MVQTNSMRCCQSANVLVICGPTASGKSNIAMEAAHRLHGEIICMDSMQIYEKMDVGTAKPTLVEQERIPHRLFGFVPPAVPYSVAEYREDACKTIADVLSRGKIPILVGGTGLYLHALRYEMTMGNTPKDDLYRRQLESCASTQEGKEQLYQKLMEVDRQRAAQLHPNDARRVIRALEIFHVTGMPMSKQQMHLRNHDGFSFYVAGITLDRAALYDRINRRVLSMMKQGLVDEVRELISSGVSDDAQSMQGIGYKEVISYLNGSLTLEKCITLIQLNSRHYAKRQWTWFRREEGITWYDAANPQVVSDIITQFVKSKEEE